MLCYLLNNNMTRSNWKDAGFISFENNRSMFTFSNILFNNFLYLIVIIYKDSIVALELFGKIFYSRVQRNQVDIGTFMKACIPNWLIFEEVHFVVWVLQRVNHSWPYGIITMTIENSMGIGRCIQLEFAFNWKNEL